MINEKFEALNYIANEVHCLAIEKGWYDNERDFSEYIANIHAELSELFEAYRKGTLNQECDKNNGMTCFEEELADIVIRVLDMSEKFNVDIGNAVLKKHEYNKTRKYRHGGKLA